MVVEARKLSDSGDIENTAAVKQALDALGYDEAAQYVYGMGYDEWKKRHLKDASDEQMKRFNESTPIQAHHDKNLLERRTAKPSKRISSAQLELSDKVAGPGTGTSSILSDVCCQDVEDAVASKTNVPSSYSLTPETTSTKTARRVAAFQPPPPPVGGISFTLAVLTVSDRASANLYESGDLSGPAVIQSVESIIEKLSTKESPVAFKVVAKSTVPDEVERIQEQLKAWCENTGQVDLIFTTGGTGFAPRDVTPEATRATLDRECTGLLSFVATECSAVQPLASLSRGTVGLRGRTFIANLPGNPKGVEQMMPTLLPILLHAMNDLNN